GPADLGAQHVGGALGTGGGVELVLRLVEGDVDEVDLDVLVGGLELLDQGLVRRRLVGRGGGVPPGDGDRAVGLVAAVAVSAAGRRREGERRHQRGGRSATPDAFSLRVKAVHSVRARLPRCRLAGLPPRLRVHRIWPGIAVPPGDWKVTAMQALQKPLLKNFARSAEGYAAVTSPRPPRNRRCRPYGRGSDS